MKLSTAIFMGRHTIENPIQGDLSACAIPMALNAVGRQILGAPPFNTTIPQCERESGNDYRQLVEEWPWLLNHHVCGFCQMPLFGTEIVYHVFDAHVCDKSITLEQMCDWIASIEPAEPSIFELPDISLEEQHRLEEIEAEAQSADLGGYPDPAFEVQR